MLDFMNITKAISDKNRVRIILALQKSPMCVCQLTSLLELAPSTTSKHITLLQQAKIIEGKRKGKWVFYKIVDEKKNKLISEILDLINKGVDDMEEIKKDHENLQKILSEYCEVHHAFHNKI